MLRQHLPVLRRRRLALLVGATAVILGSVSVTAAYAATGGGSGPAPVVPKSQRPANINPDKSPVLSPPPAAGADLAAPLSRQGQLVAAQKVAAQNPGAAVICYASDGSVAGGAVLDKVNASDPITDAAGICSRGWARSRP